MDFDVFDSYFRRFLRFVEIIKVEIGVLYLPLEQRRIGRGVKLTSYSTEIDLLVGQ